MTDSDTKELIRILRELGKIVASDSGHSEKEINKAKSLAAKLYIMHTRRDISLSSEEFNIVLDIIQFDPGSVD